MCVIYIFMFYEIGIYRRSSAVVKAVIALIVHPLIAALFVEVYKMDIG